MFSVGLLWKIWTPQRYALLRTMTGARPLAIREVDSRVERGVKLVHGDI